MHNYIKLVVICICSFFFALSIRIQLYKSGLCMRFYALAKAAKKNPITQNSRIQTCTEYENMNMEKNGIKIP